MAEISEAKRAANRENAKKSTGPRTEEGKERSRANALKHGLTGEGVVRAEHLQEEVRKRAAEWAVALKPKTGPERWLVERAAVDAARVDAAVECALARQAASLRNDATDSRAEGLAEDHAARIGQELLSGSGDTRALWRKLRSTSEGCAWMIDRWEAIARRQEAQGQWSWLDFHDAERLIGEPSRDRTMSRRLATMAADYLASGSDGREGGSKETETPRALLIDHLESSGWSDKTLFSPEDALDCPSRDARLRDFIDEEIAALQERTERLAEIEATDASEASARHLVDLSPEGVLLNRYEQELHRRVQQSLRALERMQEALPDEPAAELHPQPAPPPPPLPRNEPTAAPKSLPSRALPPASPLLPSPFRVGVPASDAPLPVHMLPVSPHHRR